MEVEIIKANSSDEDISNGRRIDRLRVAAYCRVSTDDEDQIKSYNSMVRYYTDLIKSNKQWVFAGVFADKAITGTKTDKREEFQLLIQECLSGNITDYFKFCCTARGGKYICICKKRLKDENETRRTRWISGMLRL